MNKKIIVISSILFCFFGTVVADTDLNKTAKTSENPWAFSISTDFAYYPDSNTIASQHTHFSPITGAYSGLEARTTAKVTYKIPLPFSTNPLLAGNNLALTGICELTPVSVAPKFEIVITPVAFLQFSAGAAISTAWDFIGIQGLAVFNETTDAYESVNPLSAVKYDVWAQGLFQFDLAALFPGDWNHIVTIDTYKINIHGTSAGRDKNGAWKYQGTGENFSAPNWYSSFLLGYKTPALPILNTIAINTELSSYFATTFFGAYYTNWDPSFTTISISPLVLLDISKNNS
ncbi:MAG TPA: hypothetical protein VFC68_02060, partial [Treponemataceae bacterium]|nr:hypothetical protein [Treponemataceae bacterium]